MHEGMTQCSNSTTSSTSCSPGRRRRWRATSSSASAMLHKAVRGSDGLRRKVGKRHVTVASQEAPDSRWVTIAFTWTGLRALGVDDASLATFPEEFRQGMAARAAMLGDTGHNHPDHWVDGLARPDLHAIVILFARDVAERERVCEGHEQYAAAFRWRRNCLDTGPRGHAAVRVRTRPLRLPRSNVAAGDRRHRRGADARIGRALETRRVLPRLSRRGPETAVPLPRPEVLSRNGSYLAYRRLQEHVGAVPRFPAAARRDAGGAGIDRGEADGTLAERRSTGPGAGEGRPGARRRSAAQQRLQLREDGSARICRSAGLAYAPDESARHRRQHEPAPDDPTGGTYGPPLPEGAPEDGVERGIAAFIGCASLVRQFEFAQNVWVNDRNFHELRNERDPMFGTQDGTLEYKIPKRPIRKRIRGLPAFTTVRGGAYFFLPGITALRFLAGSRAASASAQVTPGRSKDLRAGDRGEGPGADLQPAAHGARTRRAGDG